jgi:hypothetical protein
MDQQMPHNIMAIENARMSTIQNTKLIMSLGSGSVTFLIRFSYGFLSFRTENCATISDM